MISPQENATQRVTEEVVSIADQAVDLYLNKDHLQIVDPIRDLTPDARRGLNTAIGCFVVDPELLNADEHIGYKAIRDGESVILGRSSELGRFKFGDKISRQHVMLTRNGLEIRVKDLGSLNGTFIGRPVLERSALLTILDTEPEPEYEEPNYDAGFESYSFSAAFSSVASERHPQTNEDAAFIDKAKPAIAVFDGVGGRQGSGLASQIAAASIQRSLEGQPTVMPIGLSMLALKESLQAAHSKILREANGSGIATTATVAKLFKTESGQPYASIASVADSRAYLYRDGKLSFLTLDVAYEISSAPEHVQKLQDTLSRVVDLSQLSEDEADAFRRRNVISSGLGLDRDPLITATHVMLHPGDKLIVTSDGIHDNLTTDEMQQCVENMGFTEIPSILIDNAVARSKQGHLRSKADDMTAAVLTFKG